MSTTKSYASSEWHALPANTDVIFGAHATPLTVHIPTGTTAQVWATCNIAADIDGGIADWVDMSTGAKAGPLMLALSGPYSALKVKSVAGGTINVARTSF